MQEPGPWREIGIALVVIGAVVAGIGLALMLLGRLPGMGRLPGDIVVQRGRFTLFIPITTMILLSLLLTLLLNLFRR